MNSFSFDSLIGNNGNISLIRRSLANHTFSNITILNGISGTGKTTCANLAAMALTCENSTNGQACMCCDTCKSNLVAIKSTKESRYLHIINLPEKTETEEMKALVSEMFKHEHGSHNTVYILSEAHKLGDYQDAFLTEFDSMPSNVYVIMTTTKATALNTAIKSRAIKYDFMYLTTSESRLLLERTAQSYRSVRLSDEQKQLILNNSFNVPREIIKNTEFVLNNNVSEEELKEFFHTISDSQLIMLFENMVSSSYSLFINSLAELQDSALADKITTSLKKFIVRVTFLIEGGIKDTFTSSEVSRLQDIFTSKRLSEVTSILSRLPDKVGESDLSLTLIRCRRRMLDSTEKDIIQNVGVDAIHNAQLASDITIEYSKAGFNAEENNTLEPITTSFLDAFSKGVK